MISFQMLKMQIALIANHALSFLVTGEHVDFWNVESPFAGMRELRPDKGIIEN
jgi:hypothetical protein